MPSHVGGRVGGRLTIEQVTIPNGASLSEAIETDGRALVMIDMPATLTTGRLAVKAGHAAAGLRLGQNAAGVKDTFLAEVNAQVRFPTGDAVYGPIVQLNAVSVDGAGVVSDVVELGARVFTLYFRDLF